MGRPYMATATVANPYPVHKVIQPTFTLCETCKRTLKTKDWSSHKAGKKHVDAERLAKEKAKADSWGADATGSFDADIANTYKNSSGSGCRNCGQDGHFAKDCTTPKKSNGACRKCGEEGHFAKDCMQAGNSGGSGGGGGGCYNCGEEGHMSRDCPTKMSGGSGGGGGAGCYNCNETGHISRDCPLKNSGGGGRRGGIRKCHNCLQEGHISRDCQEPKVIRCNNCDEEGHMSRGCPKPTDWSRVTCKNCGQKGHTVKRCKEEIKEQDGGAYGGGFGDASTAAVGGWDAVDNSPPEIIGGWDSADTAVDASW